MEKKKDLKDNGLNKCFGIIKNTKSFDAETKNINKELKKGWKNWSTRYI